MKRQGAGQHTRGRPGARTAPDVEARRRNLQLLGELYGTHAPYGEALLDQADAQASSTAEEEE